MLSMLTVLDQIMVLIASLLFLAIGWFWGVRLENKRQQAAKLSADDICREAEKNAKEIRSNAEREADNLKKERILEAKEKIRELELSSKAKLDEESGKLQSRKELVSQSEEALKEKEKQFSEREKQIGEQEERLRIEEERIVHLGADLDQRFKSVQDSEKLLRESLERVAHFTSEEAKQEIIRRVESENSLFLARRIRQAELRAKEEADNKARRIIAASIQKFASDQVVESTISTVKLFPDDIKGKIIGRDGRNIRCLEKETGVDITIGDTAEIVLSCYDPVRREIARVALEELIADGRIDQAKIEEVVKRSRHNIEEIIINKGLEASVEAGIAGLNQELIRYLGCLHFRTSYGQNMLQHSLEVSFLAARMAEELHGDVQVAARAGLLHDIGKAITKDIEGPHAVVGARLCEEYGENPAVIHCVEAHHEDVEQRTIEAMLVQAADAISAARPGARREDSENYIHRLENLEEIACRFEGVEQAYAIQAGREVRVFVNPSVIGDLEAVVLSNNIAKSIEEESQYPGIVQVTVVRENRFTSTAR